MIKYTRIAIVVVILSLLFSISSSASLSLPDGTDISSQPPASSTPTISDPVSSTLYPSSSSIVSDNQSPTSQSTPPISSSASTISVPASSSSVLDSPSSLPASSAASQANSYSSSSLSESVSSLAVSTSVSSQSLPDSASLLPSPELQSNPNAPSLVSPAPTDFTSTIYYNASNPLGIAGSFHLVGFNTVSMNAHTNGNVLANTLYANANFGTNNLTDELSYIQNYASINSGSATRNEHVLVVGSSNTTEFVDNGNAIAVNGRKLDRPKNVWQDSGGTQFIDLATVKGQVQALSSSLSALETTNITASLNPYGGSVDDSYITLSDTSKGGVFNTTASELSSLRYLGVKGFLSSNKAAVVINVDCEQSANISLPISLISIDNNNQNCSETHIFTNGRVLWNFYNLLPNSGTTITASLLHGSIVAHSARVVATQNLNGTIIANDIDIRAESHRDDFVGEIPTQQITIDITIDKAWLDEHGDVMDSHGYSATIQLFQGSDPYGTPVTLNEANSFTYIFVGLPAEYSYSVQEQAIFYGAVDMTDSFTLSTTQNSQTSITMTNRMNGSDPLILPSTGGMAQVMITIGMFISLLAALLFFHHRRTI